MQFVNSIHLPLRKNGLHVNQFHTVHWPLGRCLHHNIKINQKRLLRLQSLAQAAAAATETSGLLHAIAAPTETLDATDVDSEGNHHQQLTVDS